MSGETDNPAALKWSGRLFFAIGVSAALFCAYSAVDTLRFISGSTLAQGTVVDWAQRDTQNLGSPEPGAYFRIIEIETPTGQRIRGQAQTGVDMRRLEIGERVPVRYRSGDPAHMRVASLWDMWLVELIIGVIATAFCLAGRFLIAQARALPR